MDVQKALAKVTNILLVQGGRWLGEKRRHSLVPVLDLLDLLRADPSNDGDFGMFYRMFNQRPASTSTQLIMTSEQHCLCH